MQKHLSRLLQWSVCLGALGALAFFAAQIQQGVGDRESAETSGETADDSRPAASPIVMLRDELAESQGIQDQPAVSLSWENRVAAYGRVVPNPRCAADVRVAFAGVLREAPDRPWPSLGNRVEANQLLGWLDVRVGPQERLDLATKLGEAQLKQISAEELVRVQEDRYGRLKAAGGGVARSELDSALTQLAEARLQLETAKADVTQWQQALAAIEGQGTRTGNAWSQRLTAPTTGEIIELAGRPGMPVEPGDVIARLIDFRVALVRLEVPPEALADGPPEQVELVASSPTPPALQGVVGRPDSGPPAQRLSGRLVGAAPEVEITSQFAAFWYEVDTAGVAGAGTGGLTLWRPGLAVKAFLELPGERARSAVLVPESALLYHEGRALVYVRVGSGVFERREVEVLGREAGCWILASGVAAGEPVVCRRAQVLLSEQFRGEADID